MKFQKRQVNYKKSTGFQPVIPLSAPKAVEDTKDKASYITFTLLVSAGMAAGAPTYKLNVKTFEDSTPQQWMDVLTSLREIWSQNSIDQPEDCANTVAAIVKGDSLTAFQTAMEDNRIDPADPLLQVAMTEDHVEESLCAVTEVVFPFRALENQKQWMT